MSEVKNVSETKKVVNDVKFLSFYVHDRLFAVPIENVAEIIGIQDITYVPYLPEYVKGVTNIRGKVVPLVELRIRFKNPPVEYNDRTCIIIVENEGVSIGYIIDEISDVLNVTEENLVDEIPDSGFIAQYIKGMVRTDETVAFLLDINKISEIDK